MNREEIRALLEKLAGQPAPLDSASPVLEVLGDGADLGYSQLNELLLLFGFDRITHAFFRYLLDGETSYEPGMAFSTADQLRDGVDRFRRSAILLFGNVKFAFKSLSRSAAQLSNALESLGPISEEDFSARHNAVLPLQTIAPEDAYLTGYLIERDLKQQLQQNPHDAAAIQLEEQRKAIVDRATANQNAYLASDHLDVYVATSMREKHEFSAISRLTAAIFHHPKLSDLKLRWFDPTQAYCLNRIDKGLSEALMLRRASCTIYLAQESDTLGKDSELASTLAQGKPVVAYIPTVTDEYFEQHIASVHEFQKAESEVDILLGQLRIYDPSAAWRDQTIRNWCSEPKNADVAELRKRLKERMKTHYDGRAKTLCEAHPLGIQVNLQTGVANGVLVVRNVLACALLIRNIVLQTLEFDLVEHYDYIALREKISGCIFRVVTSDQILTNTFWNFYLNPAE